MCWESTLLYQIVLDRPFPCPRQNITHNGFFFFSRPEKRKYIWVAIVFRLECSSLNQYASSIIQHLEYVQLHSVWPLGTPNNDQASHLRVRGVRGLWAQRFKKIPQWSSVAKKKIFLAIHAHKRRRTQSHVCIGMNVSKVPSRTPFAANPKGGVSGGILGSRPWICCHPKITRQRKCCRKVGPNALEKKKKGGVFVDED